MKKGANRSDQVRIKKLAEQNVGAEEISRLLGIEKSCVESFMNYDPVEAAKAQEAKLRQAHIEQKIKDRKVEDATRKALEED